MFLGMRPPTLALPHEGGREEEGEVSSYKTELESCQWLRRLP